MKTYNLLKGHNLKLKGTPSKKVIEIPQGDFYAVHPCQYKGMKPKLLVKKGSSVKDLIVVIGPCISVKNYEVKKDFLKKFLKKDKKNKKYFKFSNNKMFFDLRKYISFQIKSFGINKLEIINKDTFSGKNSYFSARRSLIKKENDYGRNISLIMIN